MLFLLLLCSLPLTLPAQTAADINFYRSLNDGKNIGEMLPQYLYAEAVKHFEARSKRVRETRDWDAYRRQFRAKLMESLGGPFPERNPLNASVTGTIDRDGYRIEKVIFESQPKFYVTANLYVPKGSGPFPAILFPLGHEQGAKAHAAWQIVLANMAQRGFVLLAWDPIGQGERIQLWDDDFRTSKVVQSTTEHTMEGIQTLLVGDALARYTIWDGIRALDYLLSRPEVDKTRVGITGNSGGGTHTSYIGSLDDRLHVAAPSCYLTNWRKLLETIGPQDAEQCFPGWIAAGYDHPDFIYAFAPKPFMMLSAIRDFFPIGGVRETFSEAQRVYDSIGAAQKFAKVEADDGHGYTKPRREAAYRWFTQWLKGSEDTSPERDTPILSESELNCTTTGQIATSLRGETVDGLNQARWRALRKQGTLDDVQRLTRFVKRTSRPLVSEFGAMPLDGGARMIKLTYETEPGILIPSVLFVPPGAGKKPATVLVHGRGKSAARDLALERVKDGQVVLAIDVRGTGESLPTKMAQRTGGGGYFGDYDSAMTAILLAKPLVAMRAEDISAAVTVLSERQEVDASKIEVRGVDDASLPALYATALDDRIASATLEGMLATYESVIRRRIHRRMIEQVVVGALRYYDIPDLIRFASPRKVKVLSTVDPLGNPVN